MITCSAHESERTSVYNSFLRRLPQRLQMMKAATSLRPHIVQVMAANR